MHNYQIAQERCGAPGKSWLVAEPANVQIRVHGRIQSETARRSLIWL